MYKSWWMLLAVVMLVGCTNSDSPTYPLGSDIYETGPLNPTTDFSETQDYRTIESNNRITHMYSRNNAQVVDYINYRLNEWDEFNPDVGAGINRLDIANSALYLMDPELTEYDIEDHFADTPELFHMAVYAINNALNSCFDSGTNSARCFVQWRDKNRGVFDAISDEFNENAIVLTANNANMMTMDNHKLTLTVDDSTGLITGITMADADGGNSTEYKNFEYQNGDTTREFEYISNNQDLTYSDFGSYRIKDTTFDADDTAHNSYTYGVFAGGYDSHKIDVADVAFPDGYDYMWFGGNATALITTNRGNDGPKSKIVSGTADMYLNKRDGTLSFSAYLNNWYNVHATTDIGERDVDFEFSNFSGGAYDTDFQFASEVLMHATVPGTLDVNYYGPNMENKIPSEVTGIATADEGPDGVRMDMSFGVKNSIQNSIK